MTKEELKKKLDKKLGISSVIVNNSLIYYSPTGIVMFGIGLFKNKDGNFRIGGYQLSLPLYLLENIEYE